MTPEVIRLKAVAKSVHSGGTAVASNPEGQIVATLLANKKTGVPFICVLDGVERIIKLYDPVTHTLVGMVGPAGFSSAYAQPGEFLPDTPSSPLLQADTHTLAFPSVVYWMELDYRRLRLLFTARPGDPVISACELPPQDDPAVVILTQNNLLLLKSSGETVFAVPFALDTSKYYFQFAFLPINKHFIVRAVSLPDWIADDSQQILEFDSDGKLVRQTQVAKVSGDVVPNKAAAYRRDGRCLAANSISSIRLLEFRMGFRHRLPTKLVAAYQLDARLQSVVRRLHAGSLQKVRIWHREDRGVDSRQSAARAGRGRRDAEPQRLAGSRALCFLRQDTAGRQA
jgi:hypothetical protein